MFPERVAAASIVLLRHTRLEVGTEHCYGRSEPPLAASAAEDIAVTARSLPEFDRIVSSPAPRCRRLAEFIAQQRKAPLTSDPRWLEIDFGRWEGLRWNDVPRGELDAWAADTWGYAPGGGESAATLYARVTAALADLRTASSQGGTGCRRVLVVTHGGPLRAAQVILSGQPFSTHFRLSAEHGAWTEMALQDRFALT